MKWDAADFALFGAMLVAACYTFELTARMTGNTPYRAAAGVTVAAAFILVWINLAVGLNGSEDDPANLMNGGVLAVAIIGAVIAPFRPPVAAGGAPGAGDGAGVCAQADETARKRKPIKAVSLRMRCLRVRRPSTATPPNCQAGLLRQRRVGPHVPGQVDPRRLSLDHSDQQPEPPG